MDALFLSWFLLTLPRSPEVVAELSYGQDVGALCFFPDGRTLAAGCGDSIVLWELLTRQVRGILAPHGYCIESLCYSVQGDMLVSGSLGRPGGPTLKTWNVPSGKCLRTITLGSWLSANHLALSRDSRFLLSGFDRVVRVWDFSSGMELEPFTHSNHFFLYGIAVSPDGKHISTVGDTSNDSSREDSSSGEVCIWNLGNGQRKTFLKGKHCFTAVDFSPDGKSLACVNWAQRVQQLDLKTGGILSDWKSPIRSPNRLMYSPSGHLLLEGGRQSHSRGELLLRSSSGEALMRAIGAIDFHGVAFSPDEKLLAVAAEGEPIRLLAIERFAPRGTELPCRRFKTPKAGTKPIQLQEEELNALWRSLSSRDAKAAYVGILKLSQAPEQTLSLIATQIIPARITKPANKEAIRKLIRDLDDESFAIREAATEKLIALHDDSKNVLLESLRMKHTPESSRRIRRILNKIESDPPARLMRDVRSIEILERIGGKEVERILTRLVEGAPDARLTRESRMTLDRLRCVESDAH